jgi:hypothetical protein
MVNTIVYISYIFFYEKVNTNLYRLFYFYDFDYLIPDHRILLLGLFITFKNFSLFHFRVNVGNFSEIFSGNPCVSQFIALNSSLFVNVIEKGFQSG